MGPLEQELKEILRRGFEGSPAMLESTAEGRDDLTYAELIRVQIDVSRVQRECVLQLAPEIDNLTRP